jgi:hypothetical protein
MDGKHSTLQVYPGGGAVIPPLVPRPPDFGPGGLGPDPDIEPIPGFEDDWRRDLDPFHTGNNPLGFFPPPPTFGPPMYPNPPFPPGPQPPFGGGGAGGLPNPRGGGGGGFGGGRGGGGGGFGGPRFL